MIRNLDLHKIVSQEEWLQARKRLLTQEKESTYSAYSRGIDILNPAYNYLDLVPKGRDEAELEWPMAWLRYHDQYGSKSGTH
jgi:predicted dithiol-disulfide oxidoreductase (DUF899 family)